MTMRNQLRRAIAVKVARAVNHGKHVDVTDLALELSSRYQQSGLSLGAICAEIETAVAAKRAEIDDRHPD